MKIIAVDPGSPLFGLVRPGYKLVAINGRGIRDKIDYAFELAEDSVHIELENHKGEKVEFDFDCPTELGLTFEPDKICTCKNKCIFCFVHQQPKGMRRSLYVKDDDYRLSFAFGNFISLSNLSASDIKRIVDQRLSPLYVSVHTTDDNLRRMMFKNKKLPPMLPQLKHLTKKGIRFHTQVVVCPGINDGEHLKKTVEDLYRLHPGVATLGVVPVGLTRYRQKLPKLTPVDKDKSEEILAFIHACQKEYLERRGSRFVFVADEFYILAGRDFPRISQYEQMEQFENGIGMMRLFLTDFNRRRKSLIRLSKMVRIVILTGEAASDSLNQRALPFLRKAGFAIDALIVKNRFWGQNVTVSGLLTGRDLLRALRKAKDKYDVALLPPNCLNDDRVFLDDVSLDEFREKAGLEVIVGSYSLVDTLKEVLT
jgi:putative radical SAM enzyme (TIGR03279 family)